MNVDPSEINKFDSIANEWWDTNGPMKPLHALNPLRLSYVKKQAVISHKHVLDIGCGAGILTESLARESAIAVGIDLSERAIAAAKNHATSEHIAVDYACIATEVFAETHKASFDVVTCMEMLEHVPDPSSILRAAFQMLKPNGHLFVSTINRNVKSFVSAIIGAEYLLNLLPRGTHEYKKFIKPSELADMTQSIGFVLQDIQGIAYHPLKQTFSFTHNVDVNYLMHFKKE